MPPRRSNFRGIQWKHIAGIGNARIFHVKNAPDGFLAWAASRARRRSGKSTIFPSVIAHQPCSILTSAPIDITGAGMATLPLNSWSVASIRQTSGISLEEIARNTKLKVTTLKAIEDANFDVLPGGIYNISYIRQYARAIGADEGNLVKLYQSLRPDENQSQADGR
jgi:hypothetical protein